MMHRRLFMEENKGGEQPGATGSGEPAVIENLDEALEQISSRDLGLGEPPVAEASSPAAKPGDKPVPEVTKAELTDAEKAAEATAAAKPTVRAVPKSWKPEMHETWGKLDPAVQAYIEQRESEMDAGVKPLKEEAAYAKAIRDTLAPYKAMLDAQGHTDHPGIVRGLLGAHYALSHGTVDERIGFMAKIAKQYGLDIKAIAETFMKGADEKPFTDPQVEKLAKELDGVKTQLSTEQQTRARQLAERTQAEVAAFAADPAHPYFNEVANDIVVLLGDPKLSLKDAYDKAVWANPITRAKEQERLQKETEARLKRESEEAAKKAAAARGTHVRGRESQRGSQDITGSMEDTMRETLKDIKSRAN